MERIHFLNWEITSDPAVNAEIYEKFRTGGADECGCDSCRNFVTQRDRLYPPLVLELLRKLGADYRKEVEVCHYRIEPGVHEYQGWFHLAGERCGVCGGAAMAPRLPGAGMILREHDPTDTQ